MIEDWIDKNGLVKPRRAWEDSGNGILYTALYLIFEESPEPHDFAPAIQMCFSESGLLMRTPDNKYGQEQFDNYLGLSYLAYRYNLQWAKEMITYGVEHNFVFDTDDVFEVKDFLGRYPHVFALMHEVGYRTESPLVLSFLSMFTTPRFMQLKENDASGVNLSLLYQLMVARLGGSPKQLPEAIALAKKTARTYFDEDHPIVYCIDRLPNG